MEKKFSLQFPQTVILDFDETLGYFRPAIAFLTLVAHALNEDPNARHLDLSEKLKVLQSVATALVKTSSRPGLSEFLKTLTRLKVDKLVNKIEIHSIATLPSSGSLMAQLNTSPQQLLMRAFLQKERLPLDLIDQIILTSLKDIRGIAGNLYVVDERPWRENYKFDEKFTHGYQIYPFVSEQKQGVPKEWMQLFEKLLKEKKVQLLPGSASHYYKSFAEQWNKRLHEEWQKARDFAKMQEFRESEAEFNTIMGDLFHYIKTKACTDTEDCASFGRQFHCSPNQLCVVSNKKRKKR